MLGHGHEGCGHSLVAGEAKRWSQLHRQHRQLLEQQAEAGLLDAAQTQLHGAAGSSLSSASNSSDGRPVPRMLAASGTVPIRVWVEYQGIDSLSAEGKQRLYDTVNIALGVFQKFFKVRQGCMEGCMVPHHWYASAALHAQHWLYRRSMGLHVWAADAVS